MKKVFIFDLDDTLMWDHYTYYLTEIEFLKWLVAVFNRRVPSVLHTSALQEKISRQLLTETNPDTGKTFGFSRNRFPESLARTYRVLCEEGWGNFFPHLAERAQQIGWGAVALENYRRQGLVPGAEKVLNFLQRQAELKLVLLTKGDPLIQNRKINALRLSRWFSEIRIVEEKNQELFAGCLRQYANGAVLSVGNSFSSDIGPALHAGCSAIFIPCATWGAESIEKRDLAPEEQKRLWEIKKIEEIIDIYPQL